MKSYGSIHHKVSSGSDEVSTHREEGRHVTRDTPSRLRQVALPLITLVLGSLILVIVYLAGRSMSSNSLDGKTLAGINYSFDDRHRFHDTDKPLFFEQIIDHNKPTTTSGTFPQRYYMNNKYWKGPGYPVFIIFGGEGPLERLLYPFISEILAKAFGGLTLNLEHRYFGISFPHSQPTKKQVAEELTPRQVIDDMVYFIQQQREALGCDIDRSGPRYCPVMTVGASYAGLLSTLIRKMYPGVVDMAYAASPCLLLFSHLTTPYVYYEYVTQVADRLSGGCRAAVQESFVELNEELKYVSTFEQVERVAHRYGICGGPGNIPKSIRHGKDLASVLISYTADQFISTNMDFYPPSPEQRFYEGCIIMEQSDKPVSHRMREYIQTMSGSDSCMSLQPSEEDADYWDALCCYLVPMIGKSNNTMWPASPFSLEKDVDACQRHFGIAADPDYLEHEFALSDLSHVTRLVLTNGYNDGWFPLSYTEDIPGSQVVVLNMENGAHHSDLTHQLQADTPDVERVHEQIIDLVAEWLHDIRRGP